MRRTRIIRMVVCIAALAATACSDEALTTQPEDVAAAFTTFAPTIGASDGTELFYGPQTFTRGKGKPTTETREIAVLGYGAPFTLHVRNGDASGRHRVSSGRVSLNGTGILGPSDFSQAVNGHTLAVDLTHPSVLEVQLASAPGSQITVWVEGVHIPDHVDVSPGAAALASIGATVQLTGTVVDAAGVVIDGASVVWTSSDPSVATVAANGVVTAVANGGAVITAASGEATGTAPVTVQQVASVIQVEPSTVALSSAGATEQVTAAVLDAGGTAMTDAVVTWHSSNDDVATVSEAGLIEAIANGSATVTASSGAASADVIVQVTQVAASVEVTPSAVTLETPGVTAQLTAIVRDAGGAVVADADVVWTTSNGAIAAVDGNGLVTGGLPGGATVTATSGAASGSAIITVEQTAASIDLGPATTTLTALGATAQLTATVRDATGTAMPGAAIVWTSSNEGVATVSEAGVVQAFANGNATITATSGAASASASVQVTQVAASVDVTPGITTLTAFGATATLTAVVEDANGAPMPDADVIWASSSGGVVTVSDDGVATGMSIGSATITASSGTISGAATVHVSPTLPSIVSLTATSTTLTLDETSFTYSVTVNNPGNYTGIGTNAFIEQPGASRQLAGVGHNCAGQATCTLSHTTTAVADVGGGFGTIVAGPATLRINVGTFEHNVGDVSIPITLVAPALPEPEPEPYDIRAVTLSTGSTLFLGGPAVAYSATLSNSTAETLTQVGIQAWIVQNGVTYGATGFQIDCVQFNPGWLAPGSCVSTRTVVASSAGLVAGPATLTFELRQGPPISAVTLDTHSMPVTIVP